MMEQRLAITRTDGLRALGSAGQRSHDLVVGTLTRALGAEYGRLFARPETTPGGDLIEWRTTVTGAALRLVELSPEDAAPVKARLTEMKAQIERLAERYEQAGDEPSQDVALALRNALEIPEERAVFVVEGQPVLTQWAHRFDLHGAPVNVLSRLVPRSVPAPASSSAVMNQNATMAPAAYGEDGVLWWLGWCLLGLTTAIVMYLTLTACGVAGPSWLNQCPAPTTASPHQDGEAASALDREVRDLERALAERAGDCRPEALAPAPTPAPTLEPEPERTEDDIDLRIDEAGAKRGQLTITLAWDDTADLDMHVTCPSGQVIRHNKLRACGGELDVDSNRRERSGAPDDPSGITTRPVENVRWTENPPRGRYTIQVRLFAEDPRARGRKHPFRVRVRTPERTENFSGVLTPTRTLQTFHFDY